MVKEEEEVVEGEEEWCRRTRSCVGGRGGGEGGRGVV